MNRQGGSAGSRRRPALGQRRNTGEIRTRRKRARRRRRLARIDLALGIAAAIMLTVLSPGFAITFLVAALALIAVLVSSLIARRRR